MFEEIDDIPDTEADKLIWAIVTNDTLKAQEILADNPNTINTLNKHDELALNQAIRNKRSEVIGSMLLLKELKVNAMGGDNITPLQEAAFQGDLDTTEKLIRRKAKKDSFFNGLSPWHIAIWKEHYEVAEYWLKQGADVNSICEFYPDPDTYQQHKVTSLHCAAIGGDIDFIYLLAYHNADKEIVTVEGKDAKTLFCTIHAEKWFQIDNENYTPSEAFDMVFNRAQTDRLKEEPESPVKNLALFSMPAKDVRKTNAKPVEIEGEFLISFNEIILGLVENLIEIKDESVKRSYLNIIFNPELSCNVVAKYSADLDPIFGEQFGILYCCLNPKKWSDPYMTTYKKIVIDSYELESSLLKQPKESWLIHYAEQFVKELFIQNDIVRITLTVEEESSQQSLLQSVSVNLTGNIIPTESSLKELEEQKKQIEEIQIDEGYDSDIDFHSLMKVADHNTSFWSRKTSRYSDDWRKIYEIIGHTPAQKPRNEDKIFNIFCAIQYKQQHQCRWKELPQCFPSSATVKHYYYEWKSNSAFIQLLKSINSRMALSLQS